MLVAWNILASRFLAEIWGEERAAKVGELGGGGAGEVELTWQQCLTNL